MRKLWDKDITGKEIENVNYYQRIDILNTNSVL